MDLLLQVSASTPLGPLPTKAEPAKPTVSHSTSMVEAKLERVLRKLNALELDWGLITSNHLNHSRFNPLPPDLV